MSDSLASVSRIFSSLFSIEHYHTPLEKYRARVIYAITGFMFVFWMLYAFATPDWTIPGETGAYTMAEIAFNAPLPLNAPATIFYAIITLTAIIFIATRRAFKPVATWGPFVMWYTTGVLALTVTTDSPGEPSSAIILLMVVGAMLIGVRGILAGLGLSLIAVFIHASTGAYADSNITLGTMVPQFISGAIVIYLFLRYARVFRQEGVEEATEYRVTTAQVVSEIARNVAERGTLNDLLNDIIDRMIANFGMVYHAQVFLTNEEETTAKLVASTGEVGKQLIARAHALDIGSESVIGQVTMGSDPIIARAGSRTSVHRRNELLPDTAVEAAFPLRIGDRIIGALDLQSRDPDAFADINLVATFQALADSTALAIDNVSQFQAAEQRLKENERLTKQEREVAREVERLNERLTGMAWVEYLRTKEDEIGMTLDLIEDDMHEGDSGWTPSLQEAADINHFVQKTEGERQIVAVPLRVRGQVVGAMEFELDSDHHFSPEDFEMVQEVSERFGLAAENARLVDESLRVAQREALVNQISSRLQMTNSVEKTLTEAVRGLRDAIKADRVSIRLGKPSVEIEGEINE
ncbi:MAG: GAF domain-containing protein [Aggregatilineales bacterium]